MGVVGLGEGAGCCEQALNLQSAKGCSTDHLLDIYEWVGWRMGVSVGVVDKVA